MAGPVTPKRIAVLGRNLHTIAGGSGEQAFVFVHGFGADHTTWMLTLPAFLSRGRVFAFDLPGHGRSDADVGDGTVRTFATVLAGFLDAIGVDRANLVGHSLGGAIATELALTHPARVASLTLIAPVGFSATINRDFVTRFPELTDPVGVRALVELLVTNPRLISDQMIADLLAYLARPGMRDALRTVAAAAFPGGNQSVDYRDGVAGLSMPIKLVWGAEDRILAVPESLGPAVPIALVEKAGHLCQLEAATRINRLVVPPAA